MSWLKNKIRNWLASNDVIDRGSLKGSNTVAVREDSLNSSATLNFTVYNAIGGKVIEFRRYNRAADRSESSMYVITNEDDFGDKIAKIATLEVMK